jgi:phage tail-like protein
MAGTGAFGEEPYYPMVGFFFTLSFSKLSNKADSKFKEISGIEMELSFKPITVGGDSASQVNLPAKAKFSDLVLKRGLLMAQSPLTQWCYSWFLNDFTQKLERKDVYLKLLNEKGTAIMVWQFQQAYPCKMNISGFNSMESGILIEQITLKYENITVLKS